MALFLAAHADYDDYFVAAAFTHKTSAEAAVEFLNSSEEAKLWQVDEIELIEGEQLEFRDIWEVRVGLYNEDYRLIQRKLKLLTLKGLSDEVTEFAYDDSGKLVTFASARLCGTNLPQLLGRGQKLLQEWSAIYTAHRSSASK